MVTKLKEVDAVIVGLGWTGGILAKELADTGLSIVVLERGGPRDTNPDFMYPTVHDELRYAQPVALFDQRLVIQSENATPVSDLRVTVAPFLDERGVAVPVPCAVEGKAPGPLAVEGLGVVALRVTATLPALGAYASEL